MSDYVGGSWRLFQPADLPFVYELVTKVDPRWWRFSRHGLEPSLLLATANGLSAGAVVFNESIQPVACAVLAEAGSAGTAVFDYFALPDDTSLTLARHFAPELVAAAFNGAPIRHLYYERFENDADVLGEVAELFEQEVLFPDFAAIDGHFESRASFVVSAEKFAASKWWQAQ